MLFLSAALSIAFSFRWPLLGDVTLMHYVVFLMDHGMAPYRQIVSINPPGSYLPDWIVIHLLGAGALPWHLYDLFLLLLIAASSLLIVGPKNRTAPLLASSLFAVLHLRDGLEHLGQRDLLLAALLLTALASLLIGARTSHRHLGCLAFGLCLGLTLTIKPILLPALACLLVPLSPERRRPPLSAIGLAFAGLLLPPLLALLWLIRNGSLHAFLQILSTLVPLHASLGRQPFVTLVQHALSLVAPLLALWLVLCVISRPPLTPARSLLLIALASAAFACIVQAKGYPYQRYPLLAVLLLLLSLDFVNALDTPGASRWIAVCGLGFASFVLAPRSAWLLHTFSPRTPLITALSDALRRLPVPLSRNVQCLDTFDGCIATLNQMQVEQATGLLYDCYLFSTPPSPVTLAYRQRFWDAFQKARPAVLVVTDQNCFAASGTFAKLSWPQLQSALDTQFRLVDEWHPSAPQYWWAHDEMPRSFRIYLRRP